MPSDELNSTLEAKSRLFAGDLEEFFRRDILDKARRYSATTAEILDDIEALPDEVRDDQARLARSRELQSLDVLLERVRRATRIVVYRRFSRCAIVLKDDRTRQEMASLFVGRMVPLIEQLFASFHAPDRVATWTAKLERWLGSELQRIPDKATLDTSSGAPTVEREEKVGAEFEGMTETDVDPISDVTDERLADRNPVPRTVATPIAHKTATRSPRTANAPKALIATIKSRGFVKVKKIVVEMDREIARMSPIDRGRHAPLEEWKSLAPEARSWEEFLNHSATHDRVKTYINKVPALASEITRKAS